MDALTGVKVKVRPTSYAHAVAEVVEAARWGFGVPEEGDESSRTRVKGDGSGNMEASGALRR